MNIKVPVALFNSYLSPRKAACLNYTEVLFLLKCTLM